MIWTLVEERRQLVEEVATLKAQKQELAGVKGDGDEVDDADRDDATADWDGGDGDGGDGDGRRVGRGIGRRVWVWVQRRVGRGVGRGIWAQLIRRRRRRASVKTVFSRIRAASADADIYRTGTDARSMRTARVTCIDEECILHVTRRSRRRRSRRRGVVVVRDGNECGAARDVDDPLTNARRNRLSP